MVCHLLQASERVSLSKVVTANSGWSLQRLQQSAGSQFSLNC